MMVMVVDGRTKMVAHGWLRANRIAFAGFHAQPANPHAQPACATRARSPHVQPACAARANP
eukprot:3460688-Lingulodinium_polyedra.AAC.1